MENCAPFAEVFLLSSAEFCPYFSYPHYTSSGSWKQLANDILEACISCTHMWEKKL